MERPTIVCLCGSARFRDEFTRVGRELALSGVVTVGPAFTDSDEPATEEQRAVLDALHFRKIELADEVFVVNPPMAGWPGGYFGESTRREIEYATSLGKQVRYLTNPNPDVSRGACRCGHGEKSHDAGECWAEFNGDQCPCNWYEPAEVSR